MEVCSASNEIAQKTQEKLALCFLCLLVAIPLAPASWAASTGSPFYGDPPDDHHPWAIHDWNRPQPKLVTPGTVKTPELVKPPSDAIVLFDGTPQALEKWEADKQPSEPTKWIVKDGAMECVPKSGQIRTKEKFGDCQLHVEWAAPKNVQGDSQGRGNSGIFVGGFFEIQVLDDYNNPTYSDGFACSVYGTNPPMANALRPPGEFQNVDIIFRRPVYKDGKPVDPGYVTVFLNGVVVQDHTPLEGSGGHQRRTKAGPFPDKGPLKFQDHGNPVRFRNVWIRPLPPRAIEGGADGPFALKATTAPAPAQPEKPPSDAVVLSGGKDGLGDCQLHVEWSAPKEAKGSVLCLLGVCELPALVNPNAAPGEFQAADIVFRRPVYKDGKPVDTGYVTALLNGVLVYDRTPIDGVLVKGAQTPDKGPLKLLDLGAPIRYRSIWYRELALRSCEGGTDGYLTVEATLAKRKEIAAMVRQEAAKLKAPGNPLPELLRLMESLVYEKDEATLKQVEQMAGQYAESVKQLAADKIGSKKDEVKRLNGACQYLAKCSAIPATFGPKVELEKLIKDQGWDKK